MTGKTIRSDSALPTRSRIYRALYESVDFCSRQTLAEICDVSMPTVHQNLKELLEQGLVRYSGEGRSTGGRKAQGLEIEPDARVAIGVSVTEDSLRLIAVNLRLQELAYRKIPFDFSAHMLSNGTELGSIVEEFISDSQLDRTRILGIGITIPGIMTPDHASLFFAPTLDLRNIPLQQITQSIRYPVYVDNDGSASGHAECFIRGGDRNMAYLSLEDGIGGAVLMGGAPYDGDHMRSGEFGHICVEPGGLPCNCGKHGCLEAYCSARRVEQRFHVDTETFFRGVEDHIPEYEELLYDMLRHLATAINTISMTLDCDVVLGGFFSEYLQPYLPMLKRYVLAGNPFAENADHVQLSTVPHHITPLGAALYFIREFIESV